MGNIRPHSTATDASVTRQRPPAAFAVAQFATTTLVNGEYVQRPMSLVHGKVHGTTITLCGHSALTWVKFFDLPFDQCETQRCRGCLRELTRRAGLR